MDQNVNDQKKPKPSVLAPWQQLANQPAMSPSAAKPTGPVTGLQFLDSLGDRAGDRERKFWSQPIPKHLRDTYHISEPKPIAEPPQIEHGLYNVNPHEDALNDLGIVWSKGSGKGIIPAMKATIEGLASNGWSLGIYDFHQGHGDPNHLGANDPHLQGRAVDIDQINGVPVTGAATAQSLAFARAALHFNPTARIGVGGALYDKLHAQFGARVFRDVPNHLHLQVRPSSHIIEPNRSGGPTPRPEPSLEHQMSPVFHPAPAQSLDQAITPLAEQIAASMPGVFSSDAGAQKILNAKRNIVDQIAGHQELLFAIYNAHHLDTMMAHRGIETHNVENVWRLWGKNPGAMLDLYGLNSPTYLRAIAKNDLAGPTGTDALYARYMLAHPGLAGAGTFLVELANPMSWAEDAGVGKVFSIAGDALHAMPSAERAFLHMTQVLSPFREITARFGTKARAMFGAIAQALRRGHAAVFDWLIGHLKDLSPEEQREVLQRSASLPGYKNHGHGWGHFAGTKDDLADRPDLTEKAKVLRAKIRQVSRERKKFGFGSSLDPKTFVPMAGMAGESGRSADEMSILDALSGGPRTTTRTEHTKGFTLYDYERNGQLNTNVVPSDVFYNYLAAHESNKALYKLTHAAESRFPSMMKHVPEDTVEPGLEPETGEATLKFRPAKKVYDEWGRPMIRGTKAGIGSDAKNASPFEKWLGSAYFSGEFARFLQANQAVMSGVPDDILKREMGIPTSNFVHWVGVMNKVTRAFKVLVPFVHTVGHLATNANAASRASLPEALGNYVRAISGTLLGLPEFLHAADGFPGIKVIGNTVEHVRSAIEKKIWLGSAQLAKDLYESAEAGAQVEMGRPVSLLGNASPTKIFLLPSKNLTRGERLDRFLTGLQQANMRVTFGKRGEGMQAARLFKKFTDPNGAWRMDPEDAAWAVRDVLGNYANVNPNSLASKLFFFLPWLWSNTGFWIKQMVLNPRSLTAINTGARREQQMEMDPRAFDASYELPYGTITFRDQQGLGHYSPPFPQKELLEAAGVFGADQTPLSRSENLARVMSSRATPIVKAAMDMAGTMAGEPAQPGSYHGWYDTVLDKDADASDQRKQAFQYLVELFTGPIGPLDWKDQAIERLGAGYVSRPQTDLQRRRTAILSREEQRQLGKLYDQFKRGSLSRDAFERRSNARRAVYERRLKLIQENP